jgi:hypothetical protein
VVNPAPFLRQLRVAFTSVVIAYSRLTPWSS